MLLEPSGMRTVANSTAKPSLAEPGAGPEGSFGWATSPNWPAAVVAGRRPARRRTHDAHPQPATTFDARLGHRVTDRRPPRAPAGDHQPRRRGDAHGTPPLARG